MVGSCALTNGNGASLCIYAALKFLASVDFLFNSSVRFLFKTAAFYTSGTSSLTRVFMVQSKSVMATLFGYCMLIKVRLTGIRIIVSTRQGTT